jgi:hypothetical protein
VIIIKFLHFTSRWSCDNLELNKTYDTVSWDYSYYWKTRLEGLQIKEKNVKDHLDKLFSILPDNLVLSNDTTLKEYFIENFNPVFSQLAYSSELLKEYIFEEIRQEEFSELPSRKRCMFLFDCNVDYKEYASMMNFDLTKYNLLEIEVIDDDSKIFSGDISLLDCNSEAHRKITENARKYWTGIDRNNVKAEVLFEGYFKINNIILNNF